MEVICDMRLPLFCGLRGQKKGEGVKDGRNRITFAIVAQVILVWTSCPNIAGNLTDH